MTNEPTITPETKREGEIDSEILLEDQTSHLGLIIGVLIILLTLVLIGLYVWSQMLTVPEVTPPNVTRPTAEENNEPESTNAEAKAETLNIMSTSDTIEAIEADLEATDIGDIEADLNAIDAELGS